MATDSTTYGSKGADPNSAADGKKSGANQDAGPFEAIVKGHVQGTRMGQLLVTIPDRTGNVPSSDQGDTSDQIVVSYASPFYGTTFGTDSASNANTPATAGQSYGMWLVPPDIGNKVLVFFIGGDTSRGYWFACVYDSPSHHMVPGMARAIGGPSTVKNPGDSLDKYLGESVVPVVEYDISTKVSPTAFSADGLTTTPRFPHEYQTMVLVQQGLDQDQIRGAISSSSLREAPSNVYGISTPGRKATSKDQYAADPQLVQYRKGGHQFVMDDGAEGDNVNAEGTDQLIRLRSTGGHQILMNDTEQVLYIASASGDQWMEFGADGSINVFSVAGYNLRTGGVLNLHSDTTINMQAQEININGTNGVNITSDQDINVIGLQSVTVNSQGDVTVDAQGSIGVASGGDLNLSGSSSAELMSSGTTSVGGAPVNLDGSMVNLNCGSPGSPTDPTAPTPVTLNTNTDAEFNGTNWRATGSVDSICDVVPSHEPWTRPGA